jgi:heme a synthase
MNDSVPQRPWLRRFTKLLAISTLFLVFLGGQVKSHDAGLAVPDWPTSFHYNMFLFPVEQWVGGVFHEHVHRLVASGVGLLTLVMTFWVAAVEPRRWVKNLAFIALAAVVFQGLLGGLTVLYLLPTPVSVSHGILAQTFLVMTIVIAYAYSKEWARRRSSEPRAVPRTMATAALVFVGLLYLQLVLGAVVRHTHSALAIPDFPATAGGWAPWVTAERLDAVNQWRLERSLEGHDLPPVTMTQAVLHLLHRYGALAVLIMAAAMTVRAVRARNVLPGTVRRTVAALAVLVLVQITLGAFTVWSQVTPIIATFHVVTGAALLGLAALLALRVLPVRPSVTVQETNAGAQPVIVV